MGFLADVGRSNATRDAQGIFSDVMKYGQATRQDDLATLQAAHTAQQMQIQQAHEARAQAEFDQKQKEYNTVVPVSFFLGPENKMLESQKMLVALGQKSGYLESDTPVPSIKMGRAKEFMQYLKSNPETSIPLGAQRLAELNDQIGTLRQKVIDNPEDAKSKAALDQAVQQYGTMNAAHQELAKNFGAKEIAIAKAKEERSGLGNASFTDGQGNPVYQSKQGLAYSNGAPFTGDASKLSKIGGGDEPNNDFKVFMAGQKETNPNITNAEISKNWHKMKMAEAAAAGETRGASFAASRPVQVLDTKNGNSPAIMSLADVSGGNALEPGRYIPMGAQKALGQTALIEDIRGAITNTRSSLKNLKTDFTASQAAQIAMVLKQRDPRSATSAFIGSQVGQTLTPEQTDYVTDLAQLIENGMAMRSVLGAGQGSDELRSAIMSTIPSAKTPNRAYAYKQLDKFEQQINRLQQGVPKVKLRTDTGKIQTGSPAPAATGGNWIFQNGKWVQGQ